MKYLFFDTETTGFPPKTRLVSIAWQIWNEEKLETKEYYVIKPDGFEIPYEAEKVHGISTEYAINNGVDLKMVIEKFYHDVDTVDTIVAHNYGFDENIVIGEYNRTGVLMNNLSNKNIIDTMKSSTNYVKLPTRNGRGYKWPKLDELYSFLFHTKFDNAHSANADVDATVECFFELKKRNVI